MSTSILNAPEGTTTVYSSETDYTDVNGAATTDSAVSGTYAVDNGATVAPDATGLNAVITVQPGVTNVSWLGKDAAGGDITSAGQIVVPVPAPVVNPAVSATMVLTTTPPVAPPAAAAAAPVDPAAVPFAAR